MPKRSTSKVTLTPTEYERAIAERFRTLFPPPHYLVKHNIKAPGQKSRGFRQADIGVFEVGKAAPFLVADAKRQSRTVDISKAGVTIALVQDIGCSAAVMVATSGFSAAAGNHLAAEGIEAWIITLAEAECLRWIPHLEKVFVLDTAFREISGRLVEAIRDGDVKPFLGNAVPYEEWLAVFAVGMEFLPEMTAKVLRALAAKHHDAGVRFNAIVMLNDGGQLCQEDIESFLLHEGDPDTFDFLCELRG
jgi:hypothetical protein